MHTSNTSLTKYAYTSYPNDPLNTRIYTLENGLKVYLSAYDDKPRIQTYIAINAGSKFDPKETTGLAHYLEHMMFKGTPNYGSSNWNKEKILLDEISVLFEAHKNTNNEDEKKQLYKKIDSLSYEASKYAIPNEYDKMLTLIGAKGTNAYTSNDQTVYVNDIPATEIERWCKVEAERFQHLVLRLFHTELETVYEEFNRSQDNDARWSFSKVWEHLLPEHPYGTQTTIGEGEHLKNPSMVNIHTYFNNYYVPNNAAIIMCGDLDYDSTIACIDNYFGSWKAAKLPELSFPEANKLRTPIYCETYGQQAEHVYVGYLFKGKNSDDEPYLEMLDMMLSNGKTGLIDVQINQKQRTLESGSFPHILQDYSVLFLSGKPKEGQSLEEVKDLLLEQIEQLKAGNFTQEDMKAVISNLKLQEIKNLETYTGRAGELLSIFTGNVDYTSYLNHINTLASIKREELIAFANLHLANNYVVSYKRKGEDKNRHKVAKPEITPVILNRDTVSDFVHTIAGMQTDSIKAEFIDFNKEIQSTQLQNGNVLEYIPNTINKTFVLQYIFDMGIFNNREWLYAVEYAKLLGTATYSKEALSRELFAHGISIQLQVENRKITYTISGLEENIDKALMLCNEVFLHIKPDSITYKDFVANIAKARQNNKTNKGFILQTLMLQYAQYEGYTMPAMDGYTSKKLQEISSNYFCDVFTSISEHPHRVAYYGSIPMEIITDRINTLVHITKANREIPPINNAYTVCAFDTPRVFFLNYDMIQTEILFVSKSDTYNSKHTAYSRLMNEYFGSGLSSILFQEIREQKALAYAANCVFTSPFYKNDYHYVMGYIGTQSDKIREAISTYKTILQELPRIDNQFKNAKKSLLAQTESDRIKRFEIYTLKELYRNRGIQHDIRREDYTALQQLQFEDLQSFFKTHYIDKEYAILIIGNKEKLDMDFIKSLGKYKELQNADLFIE